MVFIKRYSCITILHWAHYSSNKHLTHLPQDKMATISQMIFSNAFLTMKSFAFVQVMAWCHQATNHCLSQCWPRSIWWQKTAKIYFRHLIWNVDKCSSQVSNFTPMQVTDLWGMWAISHPCCQSLWLWSLLKLLKVIAKYLHFCQLKWQTFTFGNLILQKWHKITKIIGGIEM